MATTTLKTRLQLKYDTLTNWLDKDPVLLKGEIAVATIETAESSSGLTPPACAIRVGDGTKKFSELKWIQAVAGDVQAWAKDNGATVQGWIDTKIAAIPAAASGAGTVDFTAGKLISQVTQDEGGKITAVKYADITQGDVVGLTNALATLTSGVASKLDKNLASESASTTNLLIDTAAAQGMADDAKAGAIETAGADATSKVNAAKSALLGEGGTEGTHTIKGAYDAAAAASKAVTDLDMNSAAVAEQFIDSITQTDGKVSVTRASVASKLSIDGTYSTTNKLATVSTVTGAVDTAKSELQDQISAMTGAMRFRGTLTAAPTASTAAPSDGLGAWRAGDMILFGTAEYVVSKIVEGKPSWQLLGDEGAYQTKLSFTGTPSADNKVVTNDTLESAKTTLNGSITEAKTAAKTAADAAATADSKAVNAQDAADAAQGDATSALNKITAMKVNDSGTGVVSAVTQADGKITVTKKTLKIEDISDLTFNTAVSSTNKAASMSDVNSAKSAAIDAAGAKIADLDSSVSATAATGNVYSVLTGVTQTDGKLTGKAEVTLAAIAKTGNVNNLIQTEGDVLILDCGNATI